MATNRAPAKPRTRKLVQPANGTPHEPRHSAPPMDPDGGSLLDSAPSAISAGEQDSLMDLLAGFTDAVEVAVKVYRVVKNKPLAYVYECSPETFSMDSLRDDYGGGEFRVYIHKGGELLKNVRVMVEPPRRPAGPSDLDATLTNMRGQMDKQDKLLEALAARVMAPPPPAPGIGQMLNQLNLPAVITAFGTLLTVIRPPAPPPPPPAPAPDPMSGIDIFLKALEVAKEIKGDGGGETSMMDVVRDLIKSPMLAQAVAAGAEQQQRQLPPPRRPMQPQRPILAPVPAPQPAAPPGAEVSHAKLSPDQPESRPMATIDTSAASIAGHMDFLCAQASHGADPELYGGLVLDQLDDDTLIRLLNMPPDPVSALIDQFPQAAPYREWFEQLVAYVADAFEDTPDPVAAGAGVTVAHGLQSGGQSTDEASDATGTNTAISPSGPAAG